MKILIMRTPAYDTKFYQRLCRIIEMLEYDLTGFIAFDNDEAFKMFDGYPVYPLANIESLQWDIAVLCCDEGLLNKVRPMFEQMNISSSRIKNIWWVLQQLMTSKYEDSGDKIIQDTLKYWKTHELSVFNQHMDGVKDTFNEVFMDEETGYPYILFDTAEGKKHRMYYPKDGRGVFQHYKGKDYLPNILREQVSTSPHLYIKGSHKVNKGDILVDAGVCEGNFFMRYIDICSHVYLFEPEPKWLEPLQLTIKDFKDKVTLVTKFVSESTKRNMVALDDVVDVRDKNIFLKMDIEGAETDALHGATKLLKNNKVKASICGYHNTDDALKIKSILRKHGYKTWTSEGYMIFTYDPKIWDTADFRKGIVYAENY